MPSSTNSLRLCCSCRPPGCLRCRRARRAFEAAGGRRFRAVGPQLEQLLPGLADERWRMPTGLFVTAGSWDPVGLSRPIWSLHDGLLVRRGPLDRIDGFRLPAKDPSLGLVAASVQAQHRTAPLPGVKADQIRILATQEFGGRAVTSGNADAHASVPMAHLGHLARIADNELALVDVPESERARTVGASAFGKQDADFREAANDGLRGLLGKPHHFHRMSSFGLSPNEVARDLHDRRSGPVLRPSASRE